MRFTVSLLGEVHARTEDGVQPENEAELLEAHLDTVMQELEKLGASDTVIDLDLGVSRVTFEVLVEAPNPLEAVSTASTQIRSAIHAAHGSTPDWPGPNHEAWSVRLVGVRSAEVLVGAF